MNYYPLTKRDFLIAGLMAALTGLIYQLLPKLGGYTYFAETAKQLLSTGTPFLTEAAPWLSELILTERGYIFVFPPLPLVLMLPLTWWGASERVMQLGLAILINATTYLLAKQLTGERRWSTVIAISMALTSPIARLVSFEGSWMGAQLLATLLAQLGLMALLTRNYALSGLLAALAGLARISVGAGAMLLLGLMIVRNKDYKRLWTVIPGAILLCASYLWWNDYRFGSAFVSGYDLIPGVELEPWYPLGIMHLSYVGDNLRRYLMQLDFLGHGVGILYAQAYLLLLPLVSRNYWPLTVTGLVNLLVVLAHGGYGWVQYDFRFLLDSLWVWLPALALLPPKWRLLATLLVGYAIIWHLPIWKICPAPWMCYLDQVPVKMEILR